MKTKLLLFGLLTFVFATQIQAQDRTSIYAKNNEISDNLDLRAVASIFGDSQDLQDFERRINDPKLQISNLDLNNDNQVDYLRVIETVENRTHVIIIQAVLDRDVYQDVATIDVEKDNYNKVHVQVVGNVFMYGQNYIYEPVYYSTPRIYASFWLSNYRPYYSTWNWNYYPSYYYSWNPYPVYRYRSRISINININNNYNYVNYRRSNQAAIIYNSRRSNAYERQYPDYAFSRRNAQVTNRYELDQRRNTRNISSRSDIGYSQNRMNDTRDSQRTGRDYSQNRMNSQRETVPQRMDSQRGNSQNRMNNTRDSQRTGRDYPQNGMNTPKETAPQRIESQRDNSQNRMNYPREAAPQRMESQRDNSQRMNTPREAAPQRMESQRDNSQRMNTPREAAPQRMESQRGNSSSRNDNRR